MTQLTYLSRRRSRYYFRCRVPTDLVPKLGRRELFRSLRTADPRIARQRWHRVTIVTAELWNAVRKAMTQEEIDRHVARWLSEQLQADQLQRVETEFAEEYAAFCGITPYAAAADLIGSEAEANLEEWRKAVKRHDWERAAHLADRLIREQGLDVSRDSPEYALLCMRLTLARGELEGIRAARSLGDWTDLPPTRTVEQAEPATSPTKSPALGKLIDEYLTEKRTRGDTAPKRLLDFNAALTLFRQWCGDDTPIASIDAVKIGQFRSLLAKLPSNHTKRFPDLTLEQIVEEAEKRGLPPRDASTVNQKYLALLEAFFEWAKRGALIGSNPAVGIRAEVSRSRVRRHKRRPFSLDHLKRIYSAPLYTGCASEARIYEPGDVLVNDHRRWIPLLSLFTGARLNELCQLRVRDVRTVDGVLCLDINDEDGKRLKTRASMRLVPLHPELLRLGFEHYVASLPKGSSLWPEMETGTTGYSSDAVSKWFIRFLDKTLGHAERKRAQLSHHSFRHTMKDRMREVGIDERIQDAFIGHETAHVSAAYGTGYRPRAILAEISKVHFEGLSLEHLYPSPIPIAA